MHMRSWDRGVPPSLPSCGIPLLRVRFTRSLLNFLNILDDLVVGELLEFLHLHILKQKLLWLAVASHVAFVFSDASDELLAPFLEQLVHDLIDSLQVLSSGT